MPDQPTSLRIFRPGRHTTMAGQQIEFSGETIAAIAASYDPKVHDAPLVKGHPKTDDPAYGWVKSLKVGDDGMLHAAFSSVDDGVKEEVGKGRYRHVSAAFFRPDDAHNPTPGKWYLRHVGLLGATPPAVSGLGQVSFSADEGDFVEFAMGPEKPIVRLARQLSYFGHTLASFGRRAREREIEANGIEAANKTHPDWDITGLENTATQIRAAADELAGDPIAYSAPPADPTQPQEEEEDTVDGDLKKENDALRAQLADRDAAEAKRATEAAHAENVAFAQGLVKEGRLAQGDSDQIVALLDHLVAHPGDKPVQFAIGDGKQADAAGAFKELLGRSKPVVTFGQVAGDEGEARQISFSMPSDGGLVVDPAGLELHQRATAYAAANNVPYADAVIAVGG